MRRKIIWPVVLDQSFNFYGEGVVHTKQTKIWPSLGQIGSVVSEKKIFEKVYRWITDAK